MSRIRRLLRAPLGELSWTPPPWVRTSTRPFVAVDAYRRRGASGRPSPPSSSSPAAATASTATWRAARSPATSVLARTTDAGGRATLPKTEGLTRERAPVAYVVQKAGDLSFLPFERYDRRLDLSRFDTGGLSDEQQGESLQAFLFSDRGVYRPGEEVILGVMVKTLDWSPLPDGLPLEVIVTDPRDREVRIETVTVAPGGFRDYRFPTLATSPTGIYRIQLVLVRDGERRSVLGQTSVRVEEFLPDRMTIDARLSAPPSPGWIAPTDLRARVQLRNLIGTPAAGNRVKGTLRLFPATCASSW